MKDITVSHDMAHIGPMKSVPLIRPVCTPLCADTRFPDEIRSHASSSVYTLWERLGLVYLDEEKPETPQTSNSVIVNNFTQQIVFQLFSQKNISRLIDSNQPGFVLLDKVYREAENGRRSSGKRISALLEKRRAEKSALIRELEGVLMTFSGSRREEAAASVSGELAGAAAAAILRKAAAEKTLTERQVEVSERLLESTTHREKTRALLKELSEQIKRGGEGSLVLTESIIGQISDVLRTESVPVRTGFMRAAAEKAAELVGQDITRDEARQTALAAVSKIFRDDLSDGTANAEQIGTVGTLGTVIPAEERSHFHDTNGAEVGAALPSGEYRAAGRVVRNSPGYLSGAALFLVERAEEELDTGKAEGARLTRLSEQELKRVLTETAERNITEIQRTGATDIAKTVSEAVRAAVSMKQSGTALPARNTRESRQADGGSTDRTMPAALMRRAAGYVSDKLQYERRSGLSQLSSDRGSAFTEYRLLERADRILPKNVTVGTTLSGNDHLLSNSSGVYHAVSVDKSNRGGDSVSAVRASGGQSFSGEAKPVQGDYTVNSTELNYTENREETRSVQNNFSKSGDIRNMQNISGDTINQNTAAPVGEAKPVQGDYTVNSTELNYTENREETRNVQNDFSKSGDIRNMQNISGDTINQNTAPVGEAKPVQGNYTVNNAELNYTENREETRNIQNNNINHGDIRNTQNISGDTINQSANAPVGEAKPVQGDYTVNSTELNYTENCEETRNIQNNFSKSGDIRNIQNISGDTINQNTTAPVGEAKPVQGDYTVNSTELNYTENREDTRNIQNNFSKPGDIRNIQNISGDTINQNTAAPVGEAKPVQGDYTVNSTELNYTENREETRNIQNNFSKSGDIRNTQNISGDTINQNTAPVGEAKPVQGDYTVNSTELNYTENREETRSVQNNFSKSGDIRNIQNISGDTINQSATTPVGEAKPVQGDYTVNSTELNYTENREETRNIQNNLSKSGDIRNIQNISGDTINQNTAAPVGEAKPVQGDYTVNNAELNYIENREETRNVQNNFSKSGDIRNIQNISGDTINQNTTAAPVGEAKPVQGDYTVNSTELTYMESIGDGGISAADSRRPAGHAVPFYGKRSRALSKGAVHDAEQSLPQERGRVIPADVIPKLSFDIGEAANVAAVGNEPSSPERADISYRSEPDIFRSSQRGTQNSAQGISRSYRDKLDSRTLEELDKMLSRAHAADADNSRGSEIPAAASGRVKAETGRVSAADNELIFTEEAPEIQSGSMVSAAVLPGTIGGTEMRILLGQIRNAARLRSAITTERGEARHISRLIRSIEEQEAVQNGEMTFSRSSYSFRTVDDGENMVMLIPPTEMDRYSAESGYARQLPPIEYKQREEQAQEQKPSGKPKVINNTQSSVRSVRSAVSGGFENMTREEINKLADMVYDQIQTRVMRERRRIGM